MTRREPPRRGNACGAGPDYHDVHAPSWLLQAAVAADLGGAQRHRLGGGASGANLGGQ